MSADDTFASVNVIQEKCVSTGEWVNLEMSLDSKEAELVAYQLGISIDQNAFEIVTLEKGSFPLNLENFNLEDISKGEIKTIWMDENLKVQSFDTDRKIFSVKARALKDICNLEDVIKIDNNVLLNRFYDNDGIEKRVELFIGLKDKKISREKALVYPNPFKEQISFEFDLEQSEQLTITIYDVLGNAISSNQDFFKGRNNYTFDNTSTLKEGLLYYEIMGNDTHLSGKVIKLK